MPQTFPSEIVALIDKHYPDLKSPALTFNHLTVGILTTVIRLVDELPSELLAISGDDYADLISGIETIRNSIAFWQQSGRGQTGQPGVRGKNALGLIREALAKCPDAWPAPATSELAFIGDAALRDSIRLDISTATGALHNGEWKAVTVLAGSAVEAMLLWAIEKNLAKIPNKPRGAPDEWSLGQYISVASALSLIKENTAKQATLCQNFRNLIHPGRAKRLTETCDRGTALAALAAMELVARDLQTTA